MRDQADGAGVVGLAHAPDMQVNNSGLALVSRLFDGLPDFIHHRMVHFTVEQDLAGNLQSAAWPMPVLIEHRLAFDTVRIDLQLTANPLL